MIDKGQWWEFSQDTGVTPLLFTRSAMGFSMTTESEDLGLTSHPKDGKCAQLSAQFSAELCSPDLRHYHTTLRCTEPVHFLWPLNRKFSG